MHRTIISAATAALALLATEARAQPIAADRLESVMLAGPEQRALPIASERLRVAIDGQHASTTLTQVYDNRAGAVVEGQYHLRPGLGARVEGFAYWNGEQKIVGEVFERQTARQVYDNVTAKQRDPGLLEEDGEGRFAFKVFPINPSEHKRVELRWTKWLERRGQTVHYRAPLSRGDADAVIELVGPVKNVRSATHALHLEAVPGGVRARVDRTDRGRGGAELAIDYELDEPAWAPTAYVHPGTRDDGWFALSLAAPELPATAVAAKDVTIAIDRSGSMTGEPLDHAKAAAINMIRRLDPRDRVNVIAFSDEVDPLFKTPHALDPDTRARAVRFVEQLVEGGGTDIALALGTAIASQEVARERPRVIVFMTDGQSDVARAMKVADADTGDIRLFTLGLGKDVNRPLLSRLAAHKRGRFVYIEQTSDIEARVGMLAASIAKPLLVDVALEVDGAHATRIYPRSLPDLFAEDELVVSGRLRGTGTATFTIRGKLGGKAVAFKRTVDLARAPARPWVGTLWAQKRVDHLVEEIALAPPATELVEEVTTLALAYNFVTPYTAFLAIPESELGAMAGTVAEARERKRKVMASHADAASLRDPGEVITITGSAPIIDQGSTKQGLTITDDYTRNVPTGRTFQGVLGSAAGAQDDTAGQKPARSASRAHGCAGCATGGDAGLGLVLALLLARRRRRQ